MFQFNNDLSIEQKERILTLTTTRLPSRRQILCVPVSYPYYDLLRSIQITTESTSSNKQGVLFSYVTSGFSMYIQQARYKVCPTSIQHAADINSKYKQYPIIQNLKPSHITSFLQVNHQRTVVKIKRVILVYSGR